MRDILEGEEVKDKGTLARVKSVEDMIPKEATNQIGLVDPKIGEEQYKIIEECLRMDGTVEEACILAGISTQSYYNHRRKNPDFARRMDIARQFPKLVARAAIQRRIRQGDSKTAMEFIKLRDRRYKAELVEDEGEVIQAPVVQFISVQSNEGADHKENDTQSDTKQNSAYDISVSSGESETATPWENEEEALRRLDGLSSSND